MKYVVEMRTSLGFSVLAGGPSPIKFGTPEEAARCVDQVRKEVGEAAWWHPENRADEATFHVLQDSTSRPEHFVTLDDEHRQQIYVYATRRCWRWRFRLMEEAHYGGDFTSYEEAVAGAAHFCNEAAPRN